MSDFQPVELCNLEYDPGRGSSIDPLIDETWLWGERLVTINYLTSTVLSLSRGEQGGKEDVNGVIEIAIEMPLQSLLVLYSDARYAWLDSVKRGGVNKRRLATTLRELTPRFLPGGEEHEIIGKQIFQANDLI